jgi:hypothetical protein
MTDQQTAASPAPATPVPDNPGALSPDQAASWLEQLGAQAEWRDKLLRNDGQTRKLFDQLVQKRSEAETAEAVVVAAMDPSLPPPVTGTAPNVAGLSPADVLRSGVAALLAAGSSPGAVVELLKNEPVVSPEDFAIIEREVRVKMLGNKEWTQKLLSGDLEARRQLAAWHTIAITSRPSPWGPTPGVR